MLSSLLFGGYRSRVLGLLLLHPDQHYHVREIARQTDTSAGTLHKELDKLAQAGLLVREKVGNQLHYAANQHNPIFAELASIFRKTSGLADIVRAALLPLDAQLDCALIFGSLARGKAHAGSDVDLLLIGGVSFGDAVRLLHPLQAQLQREINPVIMAKDEWQRKLNAGDGFVCDVMGKEKIFLKGDANVLGQIGQQPAAQSSNRPITPNQTPTPHDAHRP
jgi:predicted nucleotidyltransferase